MCYILRTDFFNVINLLGSFSFPIVEAGTLWVLVSLTNDQKEILKNNNIYWADYY